MRAIVATLAAVAAVFAAVPASGEEGAPDKVVDRVVARVNCDMVTQSQIERRMQIMAQMPGMQGAAPTFEMARQLEIDKLLVIQAAKRELAQNMLDYLKARGQELAHRSRDPRVFDPAAESAKVADQYYDSLLFDAYRQRKLIDAVAVTPSEVRDYYETHKAAFAESAEMTLRDILVRAESRTPEEARTLADKAAARIAAGDDFAVVAKEVSEDPYASEGGLWPPQKRGSLVREVEQTALGLTPGQVSKPFQSALGWHVIRLEDMKLDGVRPYTEVQAAIYEEMTRQAQQRAWQNLVRELRAKAIIRDM